MDVVVAPNLVHQGSIVRSCSVAGGGGGGGGGSTFSSGERSPLIDAIQRINVAVRHLGFLKKVKNGEKESEKERVDKKEERKKREERERERERGKKQFADYMSLSFTRTHQIRTSNALDQCRQPVRHVDQHVGGCTLQ